MKFLLILLCFICYVFTGYAQGVNEYVRINIPFSQTNSTSDIAAYIKKNFNTESEKVQAIYSWVTANMRYDKDSLHLAILSEDRDNKIMAALQKRKGVCEHFAAIFNDICIKSGIKSFVIEGYTKQLGSIDKSPHAWCTALVDNKWFLFDPTWDAGSWSNGLFSGNLRTEYFETPPSIFIQSHMPFDPMFQLLDYPVTYNEFTNGNIQANNRKQYFNYADSIAAYEKMDSLSQYSATASRMENNGSARKMVANRIGQLKMEIEIINQDKDVNLYNSAVTDYNEALAIFNNFLAYRNNQFIPAKTDSEIQAMFDGIEMFISSSNKKIKEVNNSKATLALNTSAIEQKLNDLSAHANEQHIFLKNYLSSAKEK
jgi:hypothetical protein